MSTKKANANLAIWDAVQSTDPSATKGYKGAGGFSGTAVNATYLTRKATELWGPIGIGWGYEIVSESITDGAPIATKNGDKAVLTEFVEKTHNLRLKLWYMQDGQRGEVEHFGHTPLVYMNKWGIQTESEPGKKSLTDALKKCLSMLGFAADIHMGEFDDINYVEQARTEHEIKKAENKEAEIEAKRAELTDYVRRHISTLESAVSKGEINGIAKSALRHLDRQSKIRELNDIATKGARAIAAAAEKKQQEVEANEAV